MSVNKVILIGHLGKDPELKQVNTSQVCNFSLATTEKYKNKAGEKVEDTEWHQIQLWGVLAELAEKYLKKGSQVYLEGKIKTRKWEDKDGNTRYSTEVIANQMTFLGGGKQAEPSQPKENYAPAPANSKQPWETPAAADDSQGLPF
jgi:single-strand DNA-binding protein